MSSNTVKSKKYWRDSISRIVQYFTVFTNIINIFAVDHILKKRILENNSLNIFDDISQYLK